MPDDTVRVRLDRDKIRIASPYRLKDRIKAIPGAAWDKQQRTWTLPATPTAALRLTQALDGETKRGTRDFVDLVERGHAAADAAAHKTADDLPDVEHSQTSAWLHQRQAYHFLRALDAGALFMDMGTGKSKVLVDTFVDRDVRAAVIICPRNVLGVWPREFRRHSGEPYDVVVADRRRRVADRTAEIRAAVDAAEAAGRRVVVVVNYEAAWREPLDGYLTSREWDAVALDESHRIKAPGGRASRFCARLGKHARLRYLLTGTPLPHSPLDIYGQYRFLDPGIFGTSFARFRNHYAVMGGYGGKEVVGWQREDELSEEMYRVAVHVGADVLDLPDAHHITQPVTLEPAARKAHDQLDEMMIAAVDEGVVTADNALVRLLRLQQTTSGYLPLDSTGDEPDLRDVGTEKRDALAELLTDLPADEPVVVFARFTHDLDAAEKVAADLGRAYGELSGRRRDALNDDAEMAEQVTVAGVQIQAGGVGIDLTRAAYAVYYSVGFSLGDYDQSLARVHRPGQSRPVTYYHLVAEGTVDEDVYAALRDRKALVTAVMERRYSAEVDDVPDPTGSPATPTSV